MLDHLKLNENTYNRRNPYRQVSTPLPKFLLPEIVLVENDIYCVIVNSFVPSQRLFRLQLTEAVLLVPSNLENSLFWKIKSIVHWNWRESRVEAHWWYPQAQGKLWAKGSAHWWALGQLGGSDARDGAPSPLVALLEDGVMDRQGLCRFLRQRRLERATQISAFAPNSSFRRGQGGLDLRAGAGDVGAGS